MEFYISMTIERFCSRRTSLAYVCNVGMRHKMANFSVVDSML